MNKKITLMDVKYALKDERFRNSLPVELKPELSQFLDNPSCACNIGLYRKLFKEYRSNLEKYFPNAEIVDEAKELASLAANHFLVINCNISELETRLRNLGPGRKQIAIARFQDQATVIVNEIDLIY